MALHHTGLTSECSLISSVTCTDHIEDPIFSLWKVATYDIIMLLQGCSRESINRCYKHNLITACGSEYAPQAKYGPSLYSSQKCPMDWTVELQN